MNKRHFLSNIILLCFSHSVRLSSTFSQFQTQYHELIVNPFLSPTMTSSPSLVQTPENRATSNASTTFAHQIALKLDERRIFLSWKQQIEGVIRGYKLERNLVTPSIPSRFLSEQDRDLEAVNPAYTLQIIMTWGSVNSNPNPLFLFFKFFSLIDLIVYCSTTIIQFNCKLTYPLKWRVYAFNSPCDICQFGQWGGFVKNCKFSSSLAHMLVKGVVWLGPGRGRGREEGFEGVGVRIENWKLGGKKTRFFKIWP